MKHHFKYGSGYINIDDQNLYMTSSGNWQEVEKLTEKNEISEKANKWRIRGNSMFIFALVLLVAIVVVFGVGKGNIKFGFLILIYLGLHFVIRYFQREMGSRYKIPLVKIDTVEPHDGGLKITFRNAHNQPDQEILKKVKDADINRIMDMVRDSIVGLERG